MNKIISKNWVDGLMRYLANRPWSEVQEIMMVLQNLPDAPVISESPSIPDQKVQ